LMTEMTAEMNMNTTRILQLTPSTDRKATT